MTREEAINEIKSWDFLEGKEIEAIHTLIPELKESEDERIRKGLIEALKTSKTVGELKFVIPEPTREECLAYLEKQKEQKLPNGCFTCDEYKKGYEEGRRNGFTAGYNKAMKEVEQKEQKPVVTHGETYRVDTLGTQQVIAGKMPQKPAEWSKNDTVFLNEITDFFENKTVRCQHDLDMYAHWLKSLPERFNLQPKQEWSEEDKQKLNRIYEILGYAADDRGFLTSKRIIGDKEAIELQDFLRSLRPNPKEEGCNYITPNKEFFQWIYNRLVYVHKENPNVDYMRSFKERINNLSFEDKHHWKPSEEQMKALYSALNDANDAISLYSNKVFPLYGEISRKRFDTLESLYNDLKKLM